MSSISFFFTSETLTDDVNLLAVSEKDWALDLWFNTSFCFLSFLILCFYRLCIYFSNSPFNFFSGNSSPVNTCFTHIDSHFI